MKDPLPSIALADWRRQVTELYAAVRQHSDAEQAWRTFRAGRDSLFKSHSQSPLTASQEATFIALPYYSYDPSWRLVGTIDENVQRDTFSTVLAADGEFRYTRVATDRFILDFNYAYNPSCAYNDRWVCPLPLPENTLPLAVEAGEQVFNHAKSRN